MNIWIRRTVGVAALTAGLVGAGATAAQATTPADNWDFSTNATSSASSSNSYSSSVGQSGLFNYNYSPNYQTSSAARARSRCRSGTSPGSSRSTEREPDPRTPPRAGTLFCGVPFSWSQFFFLREGKRVNIWIRRSAGVAVLSAGIVVAGAGAAQATTPADDWNFSTNANSSAASGNYYSSYVSQSGALANVNVAPNIQVSNAYSSAAAVPLFNQYVIWSHH
jgi:hypothetical protein